MILSTIIIFVVILGILVFVHELGHFIMAKRAGMKVEEFGFGFPPRMVGIKRGETIYSLNWIPIGGFVKIAGEDGGEVQNPQSFANKGFLDRFLVLIAGVTMNVILAWVITSIAMGFGIPTWIPEGSDLPKSAKVENSSIVFRNVIEGSPAAIAGMKPGDTIVSINSEPIDSTEELQQLTKDNAGKETKFVLKRGDSTLEKVVIPRESPPEGQGPLGVSLDILAYVSYPWYETIYRGFTHTIGMVWFTIKTFAELIGQWVSGHSVSQAISGPVGIAVITRDVAQLGFIYLLQFAALLSINLAVINAVPFPALDGGRILFLFIEKIRGKKLPEKAEQIVNTAGFALLIMLMIFVTVRDFGRFEIIDKVKNLF
jgi:regulator of sigma E protease